MGLDYWLKIFIYQNDRLWDYVANIFIFLIIIQIEIAILFILVWSKWNG